MVVYTTFHSSLQVTPFKALYGYKPQQLGIPQEPTAREPKVAAFLAERKLALILVLNKG